MRPAQHDNSTGTDHPGGDDCALADRSVSDNDDRVASLNTRIADTVQSGGHDIGQSKQVSVTFQFLLVDAR